LEEIRFDEKEFNKFLLYLLQYHLFPVSGDKDIFTAKEKGLDKIKRRIGESQADLQEYNPECKTSSLHVVIQQAENALKAKRRLNSKDNTEDVPKVTDDPCLSKTFLNPLKKFFSYLKNKRYEYGGK
jgi:hypothetical protein